MYHPRVQYQCAVCGASLPSQIRLDHHYGLFHDLCEGPVIGAPVTFRCAICKVAYDHRTELLSHLKEHAAESVTLAAQGE